MFWVIMKSKVCGRSSYVYGPMDWESAEAEHRKRTEFYGTDHEFTIKIVKECII